MNDMTDRGSDRERRQHKDHDNLPTHAQHSLTSAFDEDRANFAFTVEFLRSEAENRRVQIGGKLNDES